MQFRYDYQWSSSWINPDLVIGTVSWISLETKLKFQLHGKLHEFLDVEVNISYSN